MQRQQVHVRRLNEGIEQTENVIESMIHRSWSDISRVEEETRSDMS